MPTELGGGGGGTKSGRTGPVLKPLFIDGDLGRIGESEATDKEPVGFELEAPMVVSRVFTSLWGFSLGLAES